MTIRRWAYLISILVVCAIAGGGWIYSRKCHGVDTCAAQSAERRHERDLPKEPQ